jgi:hypothetical protein
VTEDELELLRSTFEMMSVFAFLFTARDGDDLIGVMMGILKRHGVNVVPDTVPPDWS